MIKTDAMPLLVAFFAAQPITKKYVSTATIAVAIAKTAYVAIGMVLIYPYQKNRPTPKGTANNSMYNHSQKPMDIFFLTEDTAHTYGMYIPY